MREDPVLGWIPEQGIYDFPPFSAEGSETRYTVWSGGHRATAATPRTRPQKVLFIGDSFTQGWAVSDEDTFAWKVQERLPDFEILNLGVGGYGTYQALLRLRRHYSQPATADIVAYGFLTFHGERNTAHWQWLKSLSDSRNRGHVYVPYVSIDGKGALKEHFPRKYPVFPLRAQLASVRLLESIWARLTLPGDRQMEIAATMKVVTEMQTVAHRHGSQFVVIFLGPQDRNSIRYMNHFKQTKVLHLNCMQARGPGKVVVGDGHPNALVHSLWADCIVGGLSSFLRPVTQRANDDPQFGPLTAERSNEARGVR